MATHMSRSSTAKEQKATGDSVEHLLFLKQARHVGLIAAKYMLLIICVAMLFVQVDRFGKIFVPMGKPAAAEKSDMVAAALASLGASDDEVIELCPAIRNASASTQISPILLVALMYTESRFDKKAVSPKNYQGLMQTSMATKKWSDVDTLIGARVLQEKLRIARGDMLEALALYKGGRNPVARSQAKHTMGIYRKLIDNLRRTNRG